MLKEKEASLLVEKDDTVANLESTITRLEQELRASQPMQPSQEKTRSQDLPQQQQRWTKAVLVAKSIQRDNMMFKASLALSVCHIMSSANLLYSSYRTVDLAASNQKLREQLRESQDTNQRLMEDIHDLAFRWSECQEKLDEREKTWQEKMESQASKSAQSHQTSLSSLIKDVAKVKSQFSSVTASIYRYSNFL